MDEKLKALVDSLTERQLIEAIGSAMVGKRKEILGKVMKLIGDFETDRIAQEIADEFMRGLDISGIKNEVIDAVGKLPKDTLSSEITPEIPVDLDPELSSVMADVQENIDVHTEMPEMAAAEEPVMPEKPVDIPIEVAAAPEEVVADIPVEAAPEVEIPVMPEMPVDIPIEVAAAPETAVTDIPVEAAPEVEIPAMPEMPAAEEPVIPDIPAMPEMPVMPEMAAAEEPVIPDMPAMPEMAAAEAPVIPDIPAMPEMPVMPEMAAAEAPVIPEIPVVPETAADPGSVTDVSGEIRDLLNAGGGELDLNSLESLFSAEQAGQVDAAAAQTESDIPTPQALSPEDIARIMAEAQG